MHTLTSRTQARAEQCAVVKAQCLVANGFCFKPPYPPLPSPHRARVSKTSNDQGETGEQGSHASVLAFFVILLSLALSGFFCAHAVAGQGPIPVVHEEPSCTMLAARTKSAPGLVTTWDEQESRWLVPFSLATQPCCKHAAPEPRTQNPAKP